ncbi:hypothetical protein OG453_44235 [Streptomyces sp. NBC_01381]|uniref:hypothetical protein n=1 Tax=Streptomyces sp. NBC_01381 TaxID=2903845 RepID=UPI00225888DA|nr:hypothetical protein [Streptomyces sp. NBC_01381]MCX4673569.1 hypothetical protein [Streptomyces sp. NBC_01381]
MTTGALQWWIAETELGDCPLQSVQGVQPGTLQQPFAADPVEQRGVHVVQVWAVVGQKQLAGDRRQQRVVVLAQLVAPGAKDRADPGDLAGDAVASEDPPGQSEALEAAELVELVEGTEEIGVRREVGADFVPGPGGCALAELGLGAAE